MKTSQATTGIIAPADILTPDELAARLKVKRSWVYEKLRNKKHNPLPVIKLGKYLRFNWPDVSRWLESQVR